MAASCSWPISSRARNGTAWSWRRDRPWGPRRIDYSNSCARRRRMRPRSNRSGSCTSPARGPNRSCICMRSSDCARIPMRPPARRWTSHPTFIRRIREVCWRSCGRPSPTSSPSMPKARLRAAGRRPPCAADRCAGCPPVGRRMKCLPRRREPRRCLRSMTRARKPRYSIGWARPPGAWAAWCMPSCRPRISRPRMKPPCARVRRTSCAGWPSMECRRSGFARRPNGWWRR